MTKKKALPDPFDVVAGALRCSRTALTNESAMYRDHGWDSFGHVGVICALEEAYGIKIDDEGVNKYATMVAILELYQRLRQDNVLTSE